MKELSALPTKFPKSVRILKNAEYRKVYDGGVRMTCPYFAAFLLRRIVNPGTETPLESRFGFTTPKALGKAVVRNRIKRRMREAVRLRREQLKPEWDIVFNPRRTVMDAPFPNLLSEVEKLFRKCNA